MEELLAGIDRQYTQGFAGNENDNAGENNHVEEPLSASDEHSPIEIILDRGAVDIEITHSFAPSYTNLMVTPALVLR